MNTWSDGMFPITSVDKEFGMCRLQFDLQPGRAVVREGSHDGPTECH
jgi:hypothetical protein